MNDQAYSYLCKVFPEDLIPRLSDRGFLRAATISLLRLKYPELPIEECYNVIFRLTKETPKRRFYIRMGSYYLMPNEERNNWTTNEGLAGHYSQEEFESFSGECTEEVKKRLLLEPLIGG